MMRLNTKFVDLSITAKYDYNNPTFTSGTGHFTQVGCRAGYDMREAHSHVFLLL